MTLFNHGRAVEKASRMVADQLKELAAAHLEANVADIVLADGNATVAGSPSISVTVAELAAESETGELLGSAAADAWNGPRSPGRRA